MSGFRFPTVFLSHGTPMLAFGEDDYQSALQTLSSSLPKPKAVVILSAHSVSSDRIHVLKCEQNRIQHDFNGFPEALYELQYSCPGAPSVSDLTAKLLMESSFDVRIDHDAPLDHGIWIPMLHLYPKGDVPIVRVSLPLNLLPAQIMKMGQVLAPLREQGVLLIASGGAVHNLREIKWSNKNSDGADWANRFESWLVESLRAKEVSSILSFEDHPDAARSHPSNEHFLPVLFAIGAALPGDEVDIFYRGVQYESLSMVCFSLNTAITQQFH